MTALKCADCGGERDRPKYSYCNACHRKRMRVYRERKGGYAGLPDNAKRKGIARSYAKTYKNRGKIPQRPCEKCGDPNSQMHHHDYGRPLDVQWLCRTCHIDWHKFALPLLKAAFSQWVAPSVAPDVKREAIEAEAA